MGGSYMGNFENIELWSFPENNASRLLHHYEYSFGGLQCSRMILTFGEHVWDPGLGPIQI